MKRIVLSAIVTAAILVAGGGTWLLADEDPECKMGKTEHNIPCGIWTTQQISTSDCPCKWAVKLNGTTRQPNANWSLLISLCSGTNIPVSGQGAISYDMIPAEECACGDEASLLFDDSSCNQHEDPTDPSGPSINWEYYVVLKCNTECEE